MKPANNLCEIVTGLWFWSSLHEEWQIDFSSCAWKSPEGLVLIDPVELDTASLARLEQMGKPMAILLTNQNHERQAVRDISGRPRQPDSSQGAQAVRPIV